MFVCLLWASSAASSTEGNSEASTTPLDSPTSPPPQQQRRRFLKLVSEGDVQLCRITNDSGTVISKILGSKYLRRWETHHLYLNDAQISSKTVRYFNFSSTAHFSPLVDAMSQNGRGIYEATTTPPPFFLGTLTDNLFTHKLLNSTVMGC